MGMSLFSGVKEGPPIEVLHMKARHDRDMSTVKINLTVGGYKDEQGKPWVLPVVRETEVALVSNPATTHEYLPALGSPEANRAAVELFVGFDKSIGHSGSCLCHPEPGRNRSPQGGS